MKASHVHAAVLATCMAPSGLAFLTPPAALTRGAPLTAAPSNGQGALGTPVARLASRLAAAREDCKSCMEAELLEEERKRAGMEGEDGGERVAARRAALEAVGAFHYGSTFKKPSLLSLGDTEPSRPPPKVLLHDVFGVVQRLASTLHCFGWLVGWYFRGCSRRKKAGLQLESGGLLGVRHAVASPLRNSSHVSSIALQQGPRRSVLWRTGVLVVDLPFGLGAVLATPCGHNRVGPLQHVFYLSTDQLAPETRT